MYYEMKCGTGYLENVSWPTFTEKSTSFASLRHTTQSFVLNLREKSFKSACKEHDGADHWYLGSIAQVTLATFDLTPGKHNRGIWDKKVFTVVRAHVAL